MSCCGKTKKANTTVNYENGVKLIYSGSKQVTFLTPNRNVYVFDGKNKRIQTVHPADVDFLLSRYNKAFAMFRIYEEVVEPEEVLEELAFIAQTEDMGYEKDLLEELVNIEEEPVKKTRRKKKTEE